MSRTRTNSISRRRLALPALALTGALALAACGDGGTETAGAGRSPSEQGGGHSAGHGAGGSAKGNDVDIAFLTGMKPHHEQAVVMSEIVLAANPPAEVAAVARQVQGAQAPEIEQMDQMLAALGAQTGGGHSGGHSGGHGGHSGAHGGMMSEAEMAALEAATGTEAARLYLMGMIKHHQGAIEASDEQIAGGQHGPAIELAERIKQAQAQEIREMKQLLARL